MDISESIQTTWQAVSTVFVVYFCGYILVRIREVDQTGINYLSNLSNFLFQPALFFIRLGGNLNLTVFKAAWPVAVLGALLFFLNVLIGAPLLSQLAIPTKEFQPFFIISVGTANILALPLVFIPAICSHAKFLKPEFYFNAEEKLAMNSTEIFFSPSECKITGELYVFLFGFIPSLFIWSVGWDYLARETVYVDKNSSKLLEQFVDSENQLVEPIAVKPKPTSLFITFLKSLKRPVVWSQLVGFIVGLTPFLQNLFFPEKAPLKFMTDGIKIISDSAVSILNLIMAFSLSIKLHSIYVSHSSKHVESELEQSLIFATDTETTNTTDETTSSHNINHNNNNNNIMDSRTLFVFVLGRMIILPLVSLLLFFLADSLGLFNKFIDKNDQLFRFIVSVIMSTPTANMVVMLAYLVNNKEAAETMSLGILFQYLVGIVSMSLFMFSTISYLKIKAL